GDEPAFDVEADVDGLGAAHGDAALAVESDLGGLGGGGARGVGHVAPWWAGLVGRPHDEVAVGAGGPCGDGEVDRRGVGGYPAGSGDGGGDIAVGGQGVAVSAGAGRDAGADLGAGAGVEGPLAHAGAVGHEDAAGSVGAGGVVAVDVDGVVAGGA